MTPKTTLRVTATSHTLHEVLAELGYTHHPAGDGDGDDMGLREVRRDQPVFTGRWYDCWAWLIYTGQVDHADPGKSVREALEDLRRIDSTEIPRAAGH